MQVEEPVKRDATFLTENQMFAVATIYDLTTTKFFTGYVKDLIKQREDLEDRFVRAQAIIERTKQIPDPSEFVIQMDTKGTWTILPDGDQLPSTDNEKLYVFPLNQAKEKSEQTVKEVKALEENINHVSNLIEDFKKVANKCKVYLEVEKNYEF
jgi:hypothetical protein